MFGGLKKKYYICQVEIIKNVSYEKFYCIIK